MSSADSDGAIQPLPDDILRYLLDVLIDKDYNKAFDMLAYCTSRNEDVRSWAMAQPRPMIITICLDASTGTRVELWAGKLSAPNVNVDWGDGTPLQHVCHPSADAEMEPSRHYVLSHDYVACGWYTIRVYPNAPYGKVSMSALNCVSSASNNCRTLLRAVRTFGNLGIRNISRLFAMTKNVDIRGLDVSRIENMMELFEYATVESSIVEWDVSNVTNMRGMFCSADSFNQPIGNWNVSKVKNVARMFHAARAFNQPIGKWNVSNVRCMRGMFAAARAFNQPIGQWNVSNVTDMACMFQCACAFNQPIGQWNVSNVARMDYMFATACAFNQPIGQWNVSNVTDMASMFRDACAFNQPIGQWNVSNVMDMSGMFREAYAFNQSIGKWNVSCVRNMSRMFQHAKSFNCPIGDWDTRKVEDVTWMFAGASEFKQRIDTWVLSDKCEGRDVLQCALNAQTPEK